MKLKFALISMLIGSAAFAVDIWKHDQGFELKLNSNIVSKTQIEIQEDTDFDSGLEYYHVQQLFVLKNSIVHIAPGIRYYEKQDEDGVLVPMVDFTRDIKINDKFKIKNRARYMYEIIDGKDDKQVLRYRFQPAYKILDSTEILAGAELFGDETFEHTRTRYSGRVTQKINSWNLSLGYEYNDNTDKENSDTIVTDIIYKF